MRIAASGAITHSGTLEKMTGNSGTTCCDVRGPPAPLLANSVACAR